MKIVLLGMFLSLPCWMAAQDNDPDKLGAPNVIHTSSHEKENPKVVDAQKKAAKVKKQQEKDAAKAEKEGKKFHESIQSKNTKEMMKESRSKSEAWNSNSRPPWWKRIFMKKQR